MDGPAEIIVGVVEEIRSSRKTTSGETRRALGTFRENLVIGDSRKKRKWY